MKVTKSPLSTMLWLRLRLIPIKILKLSSRITNSMMLRLLVDSVKKEILTWLLLLTRDLGVNVMKN